MQAWSTKQLVHPRVDCREFWDGSEQRKKCTTFTLYAMLAARWEMLLVLPCFWRGSRRLTSSQHRRTINTLEFSGVQYFPFSREVSITKELVSFVPSRKEVSVGLFYPSRVNRKVAKRGLLWAVKETGKHPTTSQLHKPSFYRRRWF